MASNVHGPEVVWSLKRPQPWIASQATSGEQPFFDKVISEISLLPVMYLQGLSLSFAQNGARSNSPEWLDTVNVPYGGTVDLIMDFTDPIIKGMSLFHCHLLSHEDKGMMAKILFQ